LNNDNPLVCICIPNYNNEQTIANTIDSLLNQTYRNTIIKIFDNASTDNSIKILGKYEKKYSHIQVFQNRTNIGAEANFTKCIQNMEGKYSAIFHSDDVYLPTMIEEEVKVLEKNDICAVFVGANLIDENSNNIGEQFFPRELMSKSYHQFNFRELFSLILKYDNFLITPSVLAKVNIYKNQIKFWNGQKFKTSADLDVWLRFSEIKDIGIIRDKLILYRISTASFSYRTKFSRVVPRDMFLIIDYFLNKYKKTDFDKADYQYLKFKDNIIIISNKILKKRKLKPYNINLFDFKVLSKIITDKQKFKIYIYATLLKLLLLLNFKKYLIKLVKLVNNIPK